MTPSKLGLKQRPEGENATSLSGMTTEEKTRQRKQKGLAVEGEGASDVVQRSEPGSEKSKKSKDSEQSQRSRKSKRAYK